MQSPFIRPQPVDLPMVLKPLVYCEFRVSDAMVEYGQVSGVELCAVMATEIIHEMAFCFNHGLVIQAALLSEGGGDGNISDS